MTATDCNIQKMRLKSSREQANHLRDLPLHESQQETDRTDDYCIFEYRLRPTFDFRQEILWNGKDAEVLKPLWLRKDIAEKRECGIKRMWNKNSKEG